ncbi:hypothetical protein [Burkholderia ambifaria]|uniref:hypothetical protein n=1 Tax=Burkholderia ambifaria TaxID=152480 RepID=UPI001BA0BC69|nr:hypothetical protein [Burkholderia ambifaria]MBR8257233.1 hypothetical protein [Burkholderia ambifaria]
MGLLDDLQKIRVEAAQAANVEDAAIWRWFSPLLEEHRIRWCLAGVNWLVSVDNRHVATHRNFDSAIRMAKENTEKFVTEPIRTFVCEA